MKRYAAKTQNIVNVVINVGVSLVYTAVNLCFCFMSPQIMQLLFRVHDFKMISECKLFLQIRIRVCVDQSNTFFALSL